MQKHLPDPSLTHSYTTLKWLKLPRSNLITNASKMLGADVHEAQHKHGLPQKAKCFALCLLSGRLGRCPSTARLSSGESSPLAESEETNCSHLSAYEPSTGHLLRECTPLYLHVNLCSSYIFRLDGCRHLQVAHLCTSSSVPANLRMHVYICTTTCQKPACRHTKTRT